MFVKAEIRDFSILKSQARKLLMPLWGWLILFFVGIFVCVGLNDKNSDVDIAMIYAIAMIIALIPLIVIMFKGAVKVSKDESSWVTKEFEFVAHNGKITYNGQVMHVNVYENKKDTYVYVHDMGYSSAAPAKARFYASIKKPDSLDFIEYLKRENVEIEDENLNIPEFRRYGFATELSVTKYRRS